MPSPETPRGVLTFKILHHSRGGCATFSVQESFWFAQPSRQGWLGLLLVFMVDRSRWAKYQSVTLRSPWLSTRASASFLESGGGAMTGLPGTQLAGVEQALASEV